MSVKLLTEHNLEFLSLKGGCTGSSESTHVKMPHCWKPHVVAQLLFERKSVHKLCSYPLVLTFVVGAHNIWSLSRENLSLGFLTQRVSKQSPQLQRQARKLKFHL